jgi:F0F1-type ATP synthase membrane subunit b/b'
VAVVNPAELNLNPLSQIDPVVIVAVILIFTVTYFLLRRVFVAPYVAVMDERDDLFDVADARFADAEATDRKADFDAERTLAEAAAAAEQIRAEARERADSYRRGRLTAATQSASSTLETGRAEISAQREESMARLRDEAIDCVGVACDQLLGTSDREATEAAVDRLMSRRIR